MHSSEIYEIQAELCRTMSHPIRIEIIHFLRSGPKPVYEIAEATGHPHSTISRHLAVLRNGNLVFAQRSGQDIFYQITHPKIAEICDLMREVLAEEASHRIRLVEGLSHEHSK